MSDQPQAPNDDAAPSLGNRQIADRLREIADLLQIKGEVIYKVLAYRKAADGLLDMGRDVRTVWQEGGLEEIPGVGKAIAAKIDEWLETGSLRFYDELTAELPASLSQLMAVPDLGPKKIKLFYDELGIDSVAALEAAAREGRLRELPGMGAKSEERLLEGIASLARRGGDRIPLGEALPRALALADALAALPGVQRVEPAGSLRRRRDTVGDIDLLVAADESAPVLEAFTAREDVARVLGRGDTKASVELVDGTRVQAWVHPPARFGTALQYATGSKDHNVKLREIALKRGYSLSEHALQHTEDDGETLCATEEEVYAALELPWIPPELREDRGEIDAARSGELPQRLAVDDVRATLHTHSTWSDGRASIVEMAEAAAERGYRVLAITDHSGSLGIVQGLMEEDFPRQREEIERAQAAMGDRLRLLHGVEVEIMADGGLDLPDELLAELDIVVASLHVSLRQPRDQITERMLSAIRNPHVDVIGHPSGRLIGKRAGADLDMDAVLEAAQATGTALEINANPRRLDLIDVHARRARTMGIPITINTDAHRPEHFDFLEYGVAVARRAWLQAPQVINTWSTDELLTWLAQEKG